MNSPTEGTCLPESIYVSVCIYKKGVNYLCSYIIHIKELCLGDHIITSPPLLKRICPYINDTLCLHNVKVGVFFLVGSAGLSAMLVLAGGCYQCLLGSSWEKPHHLLQPVQYHLAMVELNVLHF